MTAFVLDPPPVSTVPVDGDSAVFPVRRILCVGRNYVAHRIEMGADNRNPPCFFAKPADAIVPPGRDPAFPPATSNLHHEVELVAALGAGGRDVTPEEALGLVFGYAVGIDLTRRDLAAIARANGEPWEPAKAFDDAAPISAIRRWSGPAPQGRIRLSVNGQVKQDSSLDHMIWGVAEIISAASKLWRLAPGDLIFTGTPEGVGPLVRGDAIEADIEGVGAVAFKMA